MPVTAAAGGWTPTTPPVGSGGTVSFSAPILAPGGTASFTITVQVGAAVPVGTVLSDTASAASASSTTVASNAVTTTVVSPNRQADTRDPHRTTRLHDQEWMTDGNPDVHRRLTVNGPVHEVQPIGEHGQRNHTSTGRIGNDTLTVDSSNGLIIPTYTDPADPSGDHSIHFDGGSGFNSLDLKADSATAPITSDTYSPGPQLGEGTSKLVSAVGTETVHFFNLAPVTDSVPSLLLTVNGTDANNTINYTEGLIPGTTTPSVHWGLVTVDILESINFQNKAALTLNGLGGDNTITVNNPNIASGHPAGSLAMRHSRRRPRPQHVGRQCPERCP